MRELYLECYSGISGDMTVAALLDLGVPGEYLMKELEKLHLDGYEIKISRTKKNQITATDFDVILKDEHKEEHGHEHVHTHVNDEDVKECHEQEHSHEHTHVHNSYREIKEFILASKLSDRVKEMILKIFQMLWGGSVTLCSMLFIVLVANWYGVGTGVLVGLAYGILQFIQEPYVLSFFQVCCDYILAFAALGVAGFFAKKKHGLLKGYIAAVLARGAFHALGGYLYWMDYMPDNFPKSLTAIYPIAYNYSFLLAEAAITLVIICIPAVAKGLGKVKQIAAE